MINLFLMEKVVSRFRGMCIQISLFRPHFLYSIFDINLGILSKDDTYLILYFILLGDLFSFNINWSHKCDHAGFFFSLIIFGLMLHFNYYDTRHYDYDNERYEIYQ